MSFWNCFLGWMRLSDSGIDSAAHSDFGMSPFEDHHCVNNPATGLPMTGLIGIEGNPFGTDLHVDHWSPMDTGSSDDNWSSISPDPLGWDD